MCMNVQMTKIITVRAAAAVKKRDRNIQSSFILHKRETLIASKTT